MTMSQAQLEVKIANQVAKEVKGLKGLERMQAAQSFLFENYGTQYESAANSFMSQRSTGLNEVRTAKYYIECIVSFTANNEFNNSAA